MSDYKPAVGEECELNGKKVTVNYIGDMFAFVTNQDKTESLASIPLLRPIRTQEELEREEAIEHIHELARGAYNLPNKAMGRAVYDAGYRLVGEKVDLNQLSHDLYTHLHTVIKLDNVCTSWVNNNYDIYRKAVK